MFALLFSYQCHKNHLRIHYLGKESLLGWDLDTPDTILRKESSRFPIEFQLKEGTLGPEDPIPSPCQMKVSFVSRFAEHLIVSAAESFS